MTRPKGYQFTKVMTVDPGPNDDLDHGNPVGNRWINTSTNDMFICVDATVGAAIWKVICCYPIS